jgi:hypothetical protein
MNTAQRTALRDTMQLLVDHEPQVNYPFRGDGKDWEFKDRSERFRLLQARTS